MFWNLWSGEIRMSNNAKNIKDDEIWCPECGAPIKKGFFTCANCKLKVKLTEDLNRTQVKKKKPKTSASKKSTVKKKEIAEPEKIDKPVQEPEIKEKEKKEILNDIFEEDNSKEENKKPGTRPGWWNYG